MSERHPYFEVAKTFAMTKETLSSQDLQTKFKFGYNVAGALIDQLEEAGIIGPFIGAKGRKVLDNSAKEKAQELYNTFKTVLEIQDMRIGGNPFVKACAQACVDKILVVMDSKAHPFWRAVKNEIEKI